MKHLSAYALAHHTEHVWGENIGTDVYLCECIECHIKRVIAPNRVEIFFDKDMNFIGIKEPISHIKKVREIETETDEDTKNVIIREAYRQYRKLRLHGNNPKAELAAKKRWFKLMNLNII